MALKKISDKEYVLKVWNRFEIKTIKHYHNLKYNVLLLVDLSEKFRNSSLTNYGLCSSHYLSAPDLSWDAMLDMKKVYLELISDVDMYLFFEKGMRDRVSYISKTYSKANNKYLKSYDPKQELKHIYLEANNFHGYAMSKIFSNKLI